jgi:plasmid stabilization system protein ParE
MSRFTLSPRAQADLDEIWDYIVKYWGVEKEFYARQIETAIKDAHHAWMYGFRPL